MRKREIASLLDKDKITKADLEGFKDAEIRHLIDIINDTANDLEGKQRDSFLNKVDALITDEGRREIWHTNHIKVTSSISHFVTENGRMPTQSELAQETGLSRQTIYKHLKEYKGSKEHEQLFEQYKLLSEKLMVRLYQFAMNGDMRAARLYLNSVENMDKSKKDGLVQNFVQINNTILKQESIRFLSKEQMVEIEKILKSALSDEALNPNKITIERRVIKHREDLE